MAEPADVWQQRDVIRRKPAKCCECMTTIAAGQQARLISMLFEGRWKSYVQCKPCAEMYASEVASAMKRDGEPIGVAGELADIWGEWNEADRWIAAPEWRELGARLEAARKEARNAQA